MYQDNSWYTTESVKIPIPIIHYVPMYVYYGIAHFGKTNAFNTVITSTQVLFKIISESTCSQKNDYYMKTLLPTNFKFL